MAGIDAVSGGGVSSQSDRIKQLLLQLKKAGAQSHQQSDQQSSKLSGTDQKHLESLLVDLEKMHQSSQKSDSVADIKSHLEALQKSESLTKLTAEQNLTINHLTELVSKVEGSKDAKMAVSLNAFIQAISDINTKNDIPKSLVTKLDNIALSDSDSDSKSSSHVGGHGSVMDVIKGAGLTDDEMVSLLRNLLSDGISDLSELMVIMGMLGGMTSVPESLMTKVETELAEFSKSATFSSASDLKAFKAVMTEVAGSFVDIQTSLEHLDMEVQSDGPSPVPFEVVDISSGGSGDSSAGSEQSAGKDSHYTSQDSSLSDQSPARDVDNNDDGVYGGEVYAKRRTEEASSSDSVSNVIDNVRGVDPVYCINRVQSILESNASYSAIELGITNKDAVVDELVEEVLAFVQGVISQETNHVAEDLLNEMDGLISSGGAGLGG